VPSCLQAWTTRENGIPSGYTLYKVPRYPPGKLDPRVIATAAPDVMYETDTGPKAGLSTKVQSASAKCSLLVLAAPLRVLCPLYVPLRLIFSFL
jgi:hypothetical protein